MKKILVPIDFSANSKNALKYALKVAEMNHAKVSVLYVYSLFSGAPERIVGQAKLDMVDPAVKAYNDVKDLIKKVNAGGKIKTEILIKDGIPEVVIIETAKKMKAGLVVIGRTGNSAIQRFFIGSTVANVLKQSDIPVLVIPAGTKWKKIKRVVFTTDLSNQTLKHAGEAAAFARYFDAELVFLYIDTGSVLTSDQKVFEMTEKLKKKVKYKNVSGFICEDITVREGIDYYFTHFKADMVVMVSHHYSFPQLIWKRSLTRRLSAAFNIPLLALVEKK
ncbi:MAG: universal stress protein [Flavobacteriales bacterium]